MRKRLELARDLLKEDGVIFISIDENELPNLLLLMEDIFFPNNNVGILKWKKKKQPSYLHGHIAGVMEFVLVFAKNVNKLEKLSIEQRTDTNTRIDNASNEVSIRLVRKNIRVKLPKNITVIKKGKYVNKTMTTEYLSDVYIKNGRTTNGVEIRAQFRNKQENIDDFIKEDVLFITQNYGLRRDLLEEEKTKRKAITDLLLDWGDNQESEKELKEIFNGKKVFDYPKPVKLMKNLIKSKLGNDVIVLDFFSGTGTAAQAVLELNEEDEGRRQFILVTNNENNIMSKVCYPRIKKIMNGYSYKGTESNLLYNKNITWSLPRKPLRGNITNVI
jgi:adenine specific DNA methylase Mod